MDNELEEALSTLGVEAEEGGERDEERVEEEGAIDEVGVTEIEMGAS